MQIKSLLCCRYTTTPSCRLWVCVSIGAEWSCQIPCVCLLYEKSPVSYVTPGFAFSIAMVPQVSLAQEIQQVGGRLIDNLTDAVLFA